MYSFSFHRPSLWNTSMRSSALHCKNYSEKRNVLEKIQIKVWIFYEKKFPFKNILKSWFAMRCTFSTRNSLNVWMGKCIWLVHVASNGKIHTGLRIWFCNSNSLIGIHSFVANEIADSCPTIKTYSHFYFYWIFFIFHTRWNDKKRFAFIQRFSALQSILQQK